MKTKPFNLEEYLANPAQKVVTRDGRDVRILCTDCKSSALPIIAEIKNPKTNTWFIDFFNVDGTSEICKPRDLFFIDKSEDELTEFEKELAEAYEWSKTTERVEFVKEFAPKLLELARKQIYEEFKEFIKLPKEE